MKRAAALVFAATLAAQTPAIEFRDVAREAGLTDVFPNGGDTSKKYIIETTGSGVGFIDYDNDGYLDIFVVSGPGRSNRMYHNDGKGHFTDVTKQLGLEHTGWGQAVCAGDYDNDGYTDLFVTYWGQNILYHNIEGKRFEDVTAKAHLTQERVRYNTSCAFLDYNNDGRLDLFVANYLKFDFASAPKPGDNPYCFYMQLPVNCGPRGLPFDRNILYRNNGDGTFSDVSEAAGITKADENYALGVLVADFNHDGRPDIFVSGDVTPSLLYVNRGDGTFSEEGLLRGVALNEDGHASSGMGVCAGDYDNDGQFDIFRNNFSDERETLYHNRHKGEFDDATTRAGISQNTSYVGWGCGFADFDNDGWQDLLLVNGHVFPEVDQLKINIHYKERRIVYRNLGNGTFADISEHAGAAILEQRSSRGAAFGDYDNDGAVEVVINNQNEAPSLLKLTAKPLGNWVILKLEGVRSNRSAIGARVSVTADGRTQVDEVRSGGSYASQSDLRLHFGLARARKIDRVDIKWPSGARQVEKDLAVNRVISIRERP
jgi:hypothetical protein